jgi:ABC-type uncharacterized transport system involved in gliding motility auxiliary subunit
MDKFEKFKSEAEGEIEKKMQDLRTRKNADSSDSSGELLMTLSNEQQKLKRNLENLARDRDRQIEDCEREKNDRVNNVQMQYKLTAVLLPPVLPLMVALGVFIYRRRREREGVARSRLR